MPYARYGETVEGVRDAILAMHGRLSERASLLKQMPPGAARNALDCALWDYEAKRSGTIGRRARRIEGAASRSHGLHDQPRHGRSHGRQRSGRGAHHAAAEVQARRGRRRGAAARIRAACPNTRLIADANEAWTPELLPSLMAAAAETRVELIEQPLPAGADAALAGPRAVPVCADESVHDRAGLAALAGRYEAINIKLDKAGGLTEALALAAEARARGLQIMVGCMVATSLSMAPAVLLAQGADWVDLDGPLLLARDREPGLRYEGALVPPPTPELWG